MTAINIEIYANNSLRKNISEDYGDVAIIKKAIAGDDVAFANLVEKYQNKVYQTLFFMLHHSEDALDLAQDTFIKAYKSLNKLRAPEAFYSWLMKIAVNLALNYLKRTKKIRACQEELTEEHSSTIAEPIDILAQGEGRQKLREIIDSLPDKQRIALVLCDMEGYSYKEIAAMLQCRIGTVMSRIYYARDYIRKQLSD